MPNDLAAGAQTPPTDPNLAAGGGAPPAAPAEGTPPAPTGPSGEPAAPSTPVKTEKPWFHKRIDELTAEKHNTGRKLEETLKALEAANAALAVVHAGGGAPPAPTGQPAGGQPAAQPPGSDYVPRSEVERLAQVAAAEAEFNRQCNDVFSTGVKEFGEEFKNNVALLNSLGGMTPIFIQAALATGEAHKVLQELAKDPDEALRIMRLPPIQQTAELIRKHSAVTARKGVSQAPAPITPITATGGSVEPDLDKVSTAEFMALRQKQIEARRGGQRR